MRHQHRQKGNSHRQSSKTNPPKKRTKVSDHFSRKDFTCKSGLSESLKISAGLIGCLEYLRTKLKNRINIIKGYECPESAEKNRALKRNYHTQGLAVNITVDNVSLEDAFSVAESIQEFTGIAINYDASYLHLRMIKGKERELWVIQNKEEIPLTPESRQTFNIPIFNEPDQQPG